METQTSLSCPDKFISVEYITILFVSSDDILHVILEVTEQQMWYNSSYVYDEKMYYDNLTRFEFPFIYILSLPLSLSLSLFLYIYI